MSKEDNIDTTTTTSSSIPTSQTEETPAWQHCNCLACQAIPALNQTDGTPVEKKIIHQIWIIESVNFVWCIAELNAQTGEAFGYANLNDDCDAEWGYIDINDIKKNGAKMIHVEPMQFENIRDLVLPKNGCPKCTSTKYGFCTVQREDPVLTLETFELWLCRNCNYQPFTNIRGLV